MHIDATCLLEEFYYSDLVLRSFTTAVGSYVCWVCKRPAAQNRCHGNRGQLPLPTVHAQILSSRTGWKMGEMLNWIVVFVFLKSCHGLLKYSDLNRACCSRQVHTNSLTTFFFMSFCSRAIFRSLTSNNCCALKWEMVRFTLITVN